MHALEQRQGHERGIKQYSEAQLHMSHLERLATQAAQLQSQLDSAHAALQEVRSPHKSATNVEFLSMAQKEVMAGSDEVMHKSSGQLVHSRETGRLELRDDIWLNGVDESSEQAVVAKRLHTSKVDTKEHSLQEALKLVQLSRDLHAKALDDLQLVTPHSSPSCSCAWWICVREGSQ